MISEEKLSIAKMLLARPGARHALFNIDGSINRPALMLAIGRELELETAVQGYDRSSKIGKDKPRKTWIGLKSPSPGRRSGHRGDESERRAIAARKKGSKR
jgi:hypothetical protein